MKHIVCFMLVISVILSSVGLSACKTTEGLKVKEIWGIDWTLWATLFVQLEATPDAKEGRYSVELRSDTEEFGSQVVTYTKGQTIPKLEWTIGADSRAFARVSLLGGKERARDVFQCDISFLGEPGKPVPTETPRHTPTPAKTTSVPALILSSCVIHEDFNDGDFTANPTWQTQIDVGCAPAPGIVEVDNGELHIKQSGAGGCGNNAGIHMDLDIPIAGKQATVSFDIKSIYSNVPGGSGANGWNYPAMVVLELQDINGQQKGLWIGYSYRGGYSGIAPADSNIYIVGHGDVPQDTWLRGESVVIQNYYPNASRITSISIRGDGWDYESRFDNICLTVR